MRACATRSTYLMRCSGPRLDGAQLSHQHRGKATGALAQVSHQLVAVVDLGLAHEHVPHLGAVTIDIKIRLRGRLRKQAGAPLDLFELGYDLLE